MGHSPTPRAWSPSFDTRLTLKQLGISDTIIAQSIDSYNEACPYPNDFDFRVFVLDRNETPSTGPVPGWKPSPQVVEELSNEGYHPAVIECAADEWILNAIESGDVVVHRDAAFKGYLRKLYPTSRVSALSRANIKFLNLRGMSTASIYRALREIQLYTAEPILDLPEDKLVELVLGISA